jgi:DNA polymerase III delta prime subunit
MALIDAGELHALLPPSNGSGRRSPSEVDEGWRKLFSQVVAATWASSGLRDLNPFTSCMVIRAMGFLIESGVLEASEALELEHFRPRKDDSRWPPSLLETELSDVTTPRLKDIIQTIAKKAPDSFVVQKNPAKTTLAYWFVDGIAKAGINLKTRHWEKIATWATRQFYEQLTYVVAGNDPLMDPASLAMAACVIGRIRATCAKNDKLSRLTEKLPSRVELTHAIEKVFDHQTDSGIWHKSFPLFHFPKSGAADYCFSFEFLEAILVEFSDPSIIGRPGILEGIAKAVRWCDNTRFRFRIPGRTFYGWNAGGEVTSLAASMPEAWATSAVHMFLRRLDVALSQCLQKSILTRFRAEVPSGEKWKGMIDVDIHFPGGEDSKLLDVAAEELIRPVEDANADEQTLRRSSLEDRRSALLFGPPGTSKTSFAKAIAGKLKWPLLIINPSDFLSSGLEQIYVRVTEVFQDLMDLSGVVVLFDEMDALAQTRGNAALDVTRQLLTTSMLPKLADLHDQARVIFFMATNHQKDLDPAITRPGRFDLLLCVGPPNWDQKLGGIERVLKGLPSGDPEMVGQKLRQLSQLPDTRKQLDLFTVADLRSFLEHLRRKARSKTTVAALKTIAKRDFQNEVANWSENYITLNRKEKPKGNEMSLLDEYKGDMQASRIQ